MKTDPFLCLPGRRRPPLAIAPRSVASGRAFTLIELLVVVVVLSILVAMVMPSLMGTLGASKITQGGDMMSGFLSEAQGRAFSQSRPVEVRFYRVPGVEDGLNGAPTGGFFRGGLLLEYYQPGELDPRKNNEFLDRPLAVVRQSMMVLSEGLAISEHTGLSTLLGPSLKPSVQTSGMSVDTVVKTADGFQTFAPLSEEFRSFVLYPETTSLDPGSKWHLTVVAASEALRPPAEVTNYYSLLIDPVTTRVATYRP